MVSPSLELVTENKTSQKQDALMEAVQTVENLSKDNALGMLPGLLDDVKRTYFTIGGVLSRIQENGWYRDAGYDTFTDYVQEEFGLKYRKAKYWVDIYNTLVELGIPWNEVGHIGWTKLVELLPILTPDNYKEWVPVAEESTVLGLKQLISKARLEHANGEDSSEDGPVSAPAPMSATSDVTTLTFKMHEDQKGSIQAALETAKEQLGTDVNTVALDSICQSFLSEGGVVKGQSLEAVMRQHTYQEVLNTFERIWPDITLEVSL